MATLAAFFGVLSVLSLALACVTGSGPALVHGLIDAVIGLVAFCIWAWSL